MKSIKIAILLSSALFLHGCSTQQQSDNTELNFQLVDYHVHLKGGLTIDEALDISKKNNVKFGIAQNCGLGFPVTDDLGLLAYIDSLKGKDVYIAMQAEGREWVNMFSPETIARCDYVFSDALTWSDHKNRRMRLWMADEVFVEDPDQFMDMYVDRIVGIITSEPIDIFVNPTFLPEVLADDYDALWTPERMDRVIKAAVDSGVAIEINARYKIPSETFIRRAQKAGVTFACGTNNGDKNLGNLEYCRKIIKSCSLTAKDMFTPKPDGQKPIQLK